jgi:ribosomal protein S16
MEVTMEPTADQKKALAAAGYAMPDGSYYIRKGNKDDLHNAILAVGRGGANHDAIRRHIIKRANAADMKCGYMLPPDWNPDGSLKHSDVDEFLEHFGVKGMHWGHRNSDPVRLTTKANVHEAKTAEHVRQAKHFEAQAIDLEKHGVRSEPFRKVYGQNAWSESDFRFYAKTGMSKPQAVAQLQVDLNHGHNYHTAAANHHARVAKKLRVKAAGTVTQSGIDPEFESDVLLHFGVKGMHWGRRKDQSTSSASSKPRSSSSVDHQRSTRIKAKATKGGGVHALSNKELQDLVSRMNLEQQYSKLETGPTSKVAKGRKFVTQTTTDTRSGINLYKTGKEAAKILAPFIIAAGAAAAANKAGGHVKYYHPSNRLAITA